MLVQLGYDGDGQPILFVPELVEGAVALPMEGTLVDEDQLSRLRVLKIALTEGGGGGSTTVQ